MRWSANRPKPSYVQYARLMNDFQKFKEAWEQSGPTARRRFKQATGVEICDSIAAQVGQKESSSKNNPDEHI